MGEFLWNMGNLLIIDTEDSWLNYKSDSEHTVDISSCLFIDSPVLD